MATLAPVIDADELLRAIGANAQSRAAPDGGGNASGSSPQPAPPVAGSIAPVGGTAKTAPPTGAADAVLATTPARRIRVEGEVKAEAPLRQAAPHQGASRQAPAVSITLRRGGLTLMRHRRRVCFLPLRPWTTGSSRLYSRPPRRALRLHGAGRGARLERRRADDHPAQRHLHSLSERQSRCDWRISRANCTAAASVRNWLRWVRRCRLPRMGRARTAYL